MKQTSYTELIPTQISNSYLIFKQNGVPHGIHHINCDYFSVPAFRDHPKIWHRFIHPAVFSIPAHIYLTRSNHDSFHQPSQT